MLSRVQLPARGSRRWAAAASRAASCAALLLVAFAPRAAAAAPPPVWRELARSIYEELVEIDTTPAGDTQRAARAMAARLTKAGFPRADVRVIQTAPKRGNMVARLRGNGQKRPLLLLAHIDVVDAKREDWSTNPFELVEKDGFFYARGSGDDKYMAAAFVTNLIRYRQEGLRPDRDIIVALTTDEEIGDRNELGIRYLLAKERALIDAELALNEGGGVGMKDGKPIWNSVQTSEKLYQSFSLTVHNPGGHSSQPRNDNAIYTLARGLARLAEFDFPLQLNDTTRAYFERMASIEQGQLASDMKALLAAKPDTSAVDRLSAKPPYNAQLRTTCVATQLDGGHAENALPQLAHAMVNCRILPGQTVDSVKATLEWVLADASISVKPERLDTPSPPSPLERQLAQTIETLTQKYWPGIPVLPTMSAGATDSRFLRNAGIPAYGHSGLASDIFDVRAHGKDERVSVDAFYRGHEYLHELVKALATAPDAPGNAAPAAGAASER